MSDSGMGVSDCAGCCGTDRLEPGCQCGHLFCAGCRQRHGDEDCGPCRIEKRERRFAEYEAAGDYARDQQKDDERSTR